MKLKDVTIKNYKSFGNNDNFLFLDKLNVIIGKNESGKSNIIDSLSGIDTIGLTDEKYFIPKNRKNNENIEIKMNFETYKQEHCLCGFKGTATIILKSYGEYLLSGDLSDFIEKNKNYNDILTRIEEVHNSGLSFSQQDNRKKFNEIFERLKIASSKIFVEPTYYNSFITALKNSNAELQNEVAELIEDANNFLQNIYIEFPTFVKIEDLMLSSKYDLEKVKQDSLLDRFLNICDINKDKLLAKMNSTDTSDIRNYEEDINENIKNNFTDEFNKFYNQENVNNMYH